MFIAKRSLAALGSYLYDSYLVTSTVRQRYQMPYWDQEIYSNLTSIKTNNLIAHCLGMKMSLRIFNFAKHRWGRRECRFFLYFYSMKLWNPQNSSIIWSYVSNLLISSHFVDMNNTTISNCTEVLATAIKNGLIASPDLFQKLIACFPGNEIITT